LSFSPWLSRAKVCPGSTPREGQHHIPAAPREGNTRLCVLPSPGGTAHPQLPLAGNGELQPMGASGVAPTGKGGTQRSRLSHPTPRHAGHF
uniref:Uncharacterized protein n=1 Tax=Gopherus agassizii TaxID=38772 RepID=A0A452HSG7_9SAUR